MTPTSFFLKLFSLGFHKISLVVKNIYLNFSNSLHFTLFSILSVKLKLNVMFFNKNRTYDPIFMKISLLFSLYMMESCLE